MLAPQSSRAGDLEWTIAPYLWIPAVTSDVTVNDDPVIGPDVPMPNVIDKLQMAFMGHFEGRGERFGAFVDVIYVDLGDSNVITPGGPFMGDLAVDSGITIGLYELAGLYRIGRATPGRAEIDIILGARQVEVDQSLSITLPDPSGTVIDMPVDHSGTDVMVGGRVIGKFTEKWGYKIRADYSGGGTEGIVQAFAAVGYTFGQGLFTLDLGYRYMNIQLRDDEGGTKTETDLTMDGPMLGFIFNF
jgi:hypothetical protein